MSETLSEIKQRRAQLQQAIDSGVQTVAYADGRQTYRDLNQMYRVRDDLDQRIRNLEGRKRRPGVVRLNATKGL